MTTRSIISWTVVGQLSHKSQQIFPALIWDIWDRVEKLKNISKSYKNFKLTIFLTFWHSTAVVSHRWTSRSVYSTIQSCGSVSDRLLIVVEICGAEWVCVCFCGAGLKLESEFPVQDLRSGQGGLLQVCMEGIGLLFANTKVQRRHDTPLTHSLTYLLFHCCRFHLSFCQPFCLVLGWLNCTTESAVVVGDHTGCEWVNVSSGTGPPR